jgi:hypothetical protein
MSKKQKGYNRDKRLYAIWKEVTESLKRSFESESNWKTRAEDNIFALKKHLHEVLNCASVQNFHSTCRALRKHVPYEYEVLQPQERADEGNIQQYVFAHAVGQCARLNPCAAEGHSGTPCPPPPRTTTKIAWVAGTTSLKRSGVCSPTKSSWSEHGRCGNQHR